MSKCGWVGGKPLNALLKPLSLSLSRKALVECLVGGEGANSHKEWKLLWKQCELAGGRASERFSVNGKDDKQ
jgi:hypothetical protein